MDRISGGGVMMPIAAVCVASGATAGAPEGAPEESSVTTLGAPATSSLPFPAQPASPPGGAEPAAVMAATVAARLQHVYDGQERGGEEGNVARMAEVSATRGSRRLEETFAPPRPWRRREVRAGGAAKRSSAGAAATMAVSGSNTVFVRNLPFDASDQQARTTAQSACPLHATQLATCASAHGASHS